MTEPPTPESPQEAESVSDAWENGGTSWWTDPRVVKVPDAANSIVVGVVDAIEGEISLRRKGTGVDEKLVLTTPSPYTDDHNNPAFLAVDGKPLLAAYNFHNQDNFLRVRRSLENIDFDDPEWFGGLGDEVKLSPGGKTSYAEIRHLPGTDIVYVFFRLRTSRHWWAAMRSTDWGQTWARVLLVNGGAQTTSFYMPSRMLDDGETMAFACASHPQYNVNNDIYYGQVNLSSGDITAGGSVVGNLYSGAGVAYTALEKVTPSVDASTQGVWVYDVSEDAVTYCQFTRSSPSDCMYRYGHKSGGTWTTHPIVAAGEPFQPSTNFYFPGAQIGPNGEVGLTRRDGSTWRTEVYTTADGGSSWAVNELRSAANLNARPWFVENGASGSTLMVGDYSVYSTYLSWAGDVVIV